MINLTAVLKKYTKHLTYDLQSTHGKFWINRSSYVEGFEGTSKYYNWAFYNH